MPERFLDLYMISDSGRASACTNFGLFFRFSRFSPFAEEGFTCLDHSAMNEKKKESSQGRIHSFSVAFGSSPLAQAHLGSSEFTLNSQETFGRVRGVMSAEAC